MNKPTKAPKRKSQPAAPIIFALFVFIALATVVLLEYIDYRSQRYSFIFTQLIKLKGTAGHRQKFSNELETTLKTLQAEFDSIRDSHGIVHYRIHADDDQYRSLITALNQEAKKHHASIELTASQERKDKNLYLFQVHFGNQLTHLLLVFKIAKIDIPEVKKETAGSLPRMAIIIDDIGYRPLAADDLKGLGIKVTAAVIPNAPYAESEAQSLRRFGIETIIHLPMESKNSEKNHLEDQLITSDSTSAEISAFVRKAITVVPGARGANNHMGSLITSSRELSARVLKILKEENLFFIDSRTAPRSVAYDIAKELHIKTYYRSVFLDDIQDYTLTVGQIRRLVAMAKRTGKSLGIGHPFETTLAALRDSASWLSRQNLSIVPASDLLE